MQEFVSFPKYTFGGMRIDRIFKFSMFTAAQTCFFAVCTNTAYVGYAVLDLQCSAASDNPWIAFFHMSRQVCYTS
jgi:hypothetical protein